MSRIRVMIIEDSALTRSVLERIISADSDIEVVGTAMDPIFAAKKIQTINPDVITLDLVMPRMDGLTFLTKLMKSRPTPVIVISGNSPKASINAIRALELGAIDIIEKPDISTPVRLREVSESITLAIKAAYSSLDPNKTNSSVNLFAESFSPPVILQDNTNGRRLKKTPFIVIGSSTGGPETLRQLLSNIKPSCPGIVIAQHMPAVFTKSFANRLDSELQLKVVEAEDGERIMNGKVIILPGDYHGQVSKDQNGYYIRLSQTEKVNRQRPSVDTLFNSAASVGAGNITGILLTGMGDDGARGLMNLCEAGANTIAQSGETCVVFGMPRKAIELGAAKMVMNPVQITSFINENIEI